MGHDPGFNLLDPDAVKGRLPELLATRPVPDLLHDLRAAAKWFVPDERLVAAVNAALAVGAPLLLTGAPGTGKTQLAYYLWHYFGVPDLDLDEEKHPQPFCLHVKSTTVSDDLLYRFDTVAYFHASQEPARHGEAIDKREFRRKGPLWLAFEALGRGLPAIVLIDEIDKAARDFPNDLLHELDQYEFTCQETGEMLRRPEGIAPPVVVVTSNDEKRLPEPFLRRCVFFHIELDKDTVERAVARRAKAMGLDLALQTAALARFWEVRGLPSLRKKPSTGELLAWLAALRRADVSGEQLADLPLARLPHVGVLLKDREDLRRLG